MASERIEIVECIERVERVERIQRVMRVAPGTARDRSPAVAEVIDIEPRVSAGPGAPRGLVLNGVWVPLAR
ncbi:hypothetical protein CS062_14070 [Roseateles chitinivorans]|jgi:hypothetical protein|uniref:Uncharacterized protein n=1 Tax=Roseateles chitinivorans TaxID=2917965 RepID=A0A2G9C832_9BURK|nr:hypothetical protein [Roseateles chitinivorans]PIM52576.1 hypothetical protein CS062_14070 [Roseateles chitinivorans]